MFSKLSNIRVDLYCHSSNSFIKRNNSLPSNTEVAQYHIIIIALITWIHCVILGSRVVGVLQLKEACDEEHISRRLV